MYTKIYKRCIAFGLILSLFYALILALPIHAFAEEEELSFGIFKYVVNADRTITITDCDKSAAGEVEVPDTIDRRDVTAIGVQAFENCKEITGVILPDTIKTIGQYAFLACSQLFEIILPDSVVSIGDMAFGSCSSLYRVQFGDSLVSIDDMAFINCESLSTVVIPDSVQRIGDFAFNECISLTSLTVGKSLVELGSHAFNRCISLSMALFLGNPPQIFGQNAFKNTSPGFTICYLEENAPSWTKNGGKTYLDYPIAMYVPTSPDQNFNYIVQGKDATITGYKGTGGNVAIPEKIHDYTVVAIAENAFRNCETITGMTMPDTVVSVGRHAFLSCTKLSNVSLGSMVSSIGVGAFKSCDALRAIDVNKANPAFTSYNGVLYSKDMTSLICYPPGLEGVFEIPSGVVHIRENAFDACTKLTGVVMPSGVTEIGDFAFSGSGLTNVVIHKEATFGAHAFSKCAELKTVVLEEGLQRISDFAFASSALLNLIIPDSVADIGEFAFMGCGSLKTVTLGNGITKIADGLFSDCTSLESIVIPDGVTLIGCEAFSGCAKLKSADFGKGTAVIDDAAFAECESLLELALPQSLRMIGHGAFAWCASLKGVTIPNGVTVMGESVFESCSALNSVVLGKGLTAISNFMFIDCPSLMSVTIPDTIIAIGESAFKFCKKLKTVTIGRGVESIGGWAFGYCPNLICAIFMGAPPKTFGIDVFNNVGQGFKIYYQEEFKSSWAPDGGNTWQGYDIAPYEGASDLDSLLKKESGLVIDRAAGFLSGVAPHTSVEGLLACFGPDHLLVLNSSGETIENSGVIATGFYLRLMRDGSVADELIIVVAGDVFADGVINTLDIAGVQKIILGTEPASWFKRAADISGDGLVNTMDIAALQKLILGK